MRVRVLATILILIVGVGVFIGIYGLQQNWFNTFDPGNRYQSQRLDYMGVIYDNRSSQYGFFEGYSETNSSPWGFIHNGIDYFFNNNTDVTAGAPGYVEDISWRVNPDTTLNMYNIFVMIRFNASIVLHYAFEPFTHVEGDQNRQLTMLEIQVGDWVMKGDLIGRFLFVEDGAHIHFGVRAGNEWLDPEPFFGAADHDEIMGLINDYHPGWNVSYPAP
ncbi:MAG: peptidoglycan DD-metalloendopeptidase family protein [Candidatus Thorarchaeota archaeon]|nr:peptidoglycan DD-metalloendopeptidase family protein [Candidatus Thorarchaeota archaeon]